jgi:hypothetical protein
VRPASRIDSEYPLPFGTKVEKDVGSPVYAHLSSGFSRSVMAFMLNAGSLKDFSICHTLACITSGVPSSQGNDDFSFFNDP